MCAALLFPVCAGASYINKTNTPVSTKNGFLDVEVENMPYDNDYFTVWNDSMFSDGKALAPITEDKTVPSASAAAHIDLSFTADKSGTYSVWIRHTAEVENRRGQSVFVSVGGASYSNFRLTGDPDNPVWLKIASFTVNEGNVGSVRLRRRQRVSIGFDRCIITSDPSYVPDDSGIYTPVANPYPDPGIELPARHPRVYFKEGDIERILEDKEKGENVYAWRLQQQNLETGLSDSFTGILPTPEGGKTNDNGSITVCIEALAFDYLINKNRKSGEKAVTSLKNYLNSVVFTGAYSDTYFRPAGQLIFHVAEVYDWCYDLLDSKTKKYFTDRVIEIAGNGLEVRWPFDGSGVASHESEAQLQRDLLAFSIAAGDERPDIFKRMMGVMYKNYVPQRTRIYNSLMPNQGSQYGCYRGRWELLATILMDKIGVPNLYGENQRYFPYFYLYARRPDGLIMRDGDARTDGNEIGAFMTRPDIIRVMLLSSYYFKDEYLKKEFDRNFAAMRSFASGHDGMSPVEFICFYDAELGTKEKDELPLTRYFPSPKGAMFARTGFNDGLYSDDAVAYMNVEEYNFSNHDHIDAGHFQIYYKGILANDAGTYGSYGSAHDRGYYKRSVAHNTMAVRNPSSPTTFQGYTTYDGGQRSGNDGADAGANIFETEEYRFGEILGHEFGGDDKEPDYSYLSGNIRRAYKSDTVENYERSFMFYNLKNKDHPAAMIVFDRITSVSPSYKKAWLLNGPLRPAVSGNRTVFYNTENGYNGKMTVDTLLPEKTETVIIGGEGQDAYVGGVNYSAGVTLNPDLSHEAQGYRVEISPQIDSSKDLFLNVIQVGDADSEVEAYRPLLIQNNRCAGVIMGRTVTIFKTDYGRSRKSVSFTLPEGSYRIAVCDNAAGNWSVIKDGNVSGSLQASEEGGVLYFDGSGGEYSVTYTGDDSGAADITATWKDTGINPMENEVFFSVSGALIEGETELPRGTKIYTGVYDSENRLLDFKINAYPTFGIFESKRLRKSYNGAATSYVKLFVWNGLKPLSEKEVLTVSDFENYVRGNVSDIRGTLHFDKKHGEITDELTVYSVLQSGSEYGIGGNDITKTLDGDFSTRWAVEGTMVNPSFGIYDFGSVKELDKLYLAYYKGSSRKAYFKIETAGEDGNFTSVIENGESSGGTDGFEVYNLGGVRARYLKIYGCGNNSSGSASWNSVTELAVSGR